MQEYSINFDEKPSADDCRILWQGLREFNVSQTGLEVGRIALFLRDNEGNMIGGTLGWTYLDCLHIDLLWVRGDARGQGYGKRLLFAAEQEAIKRSCRHAELDTFSFQAPDFYRKLGYRIFGKVDIAGKHTWYFLEKDLL